MAIDIIRPDGTSRTVGPGEAFGFADAQREVQGYIEVVPVSGGAKALVNEEGRVRGLLPNRAASARAGYPLVGTVVIVSGPDVRRVLGAR